MPERKKIEIAKKLLMLIREVEDPKLKNELTTILKKHFPDLADNLLKNEEIRMKNAKDLIELMMESNNEEIKRQSIFVLLEDFSDISKNLLKEVAIKNPKILDIKKEVAKSIVEYESISGFDHNNNPIFKRRVDLLPKGTTKEQKELFKKRQKEKNQEAIILQKKIAQMEIDIPKRKML